MGEALCVVPSSDGLDCITSVEDLERIGPAEEIFEAARQTIQSEKAYVDVLSFVDDVLLAEMHQWVDAGFFRHPEEMQIWWQVFCCSDGSVEHVAATRESLSFIHQHFWKVQQRAGFYMSLVNSVVDCEVQPSIILVAALEYLSSTATGVKQQDETLFEKERRHPKEEVFSRIAKVCADSCVLFPRLKPAVVQLLEHFLSTGDDTPPAKRLKTGEPGSSKQEGPLSLFLRERKGVLVESLLVYCKGGKQPKTESNFTRVACFPETKLVHRLQKLNQTSLAELTVNWRTISAEFLRESDLHGSISFQNGLSLLTANVLDELAGCLDALAFTKDHSLAVFEIVHRLAFGVFPLLFPQGEALCNLSSFSYESLRHDCWSRLLVYLQSGMKDPTSECSHAIVVVSTIIILVLQILHSRVSSGNTQHLHDYTHFVVVLTSQLRKGGIDPAKYLDDQILGSPIDVMASSKGDRLCSILKASVEILLTRESPINLKSLFQVMSCELHAYAISIFFFLTFKSLIFLFHDKFSSGIIGDF